eukprot:TRINITY_DN1609_c0_g1_i11.p2 TRINITY_DN1609_c0_g1~~TRINITY_DN1609_c0_g1_i11.p2  ORF type:complete len:104 (-),score=10.85 TRINITY_DN1609_c0_g1_i11:952-1263(-)
MFTIHAIYYGVSRLVFGVLSCTLEDAGTGKWYLNMYPWIVCDPISPEYSDMLSIAIPFFIVFVLGFPAFIYYYLKKLQPDFRKDVVQERYGFLYLPYRPVSES